ncbi:hypothetical protein [Aquimarina agarilytica]|uniref:hypothetical protein n=1 Tax=Aquimarina agarilytica TaxID=1087449 RepID=UPI0002DEE111|nr:hypothetical protein [Aquimarina agarilytica]
MKSNRNRRRLNYFIKVNIESSYSKVAPELILNTGLFDFYLNNQTPIKTNFSA